MITHISLITRYVTDQDEAKTFYTENLGFVAKNDVTMGVEFRWVTIYHPNHPELEVTLMVPGPPLDEDMASRSSELKRKGRWADSGSRPTTAGRLMRNFPLRASSSLSHRRSAPTVSKQYCGTTPETGWYSSNSVNTQTPISAPARTRRGSNGLRDPLALVARSKTFPECVEGSRRSARLCS